MTYMNKNHKCSDFEEMLMWTSYRYCIGRHTCVVTMADDIGKHYYNKLSKERKEFTAQDIRHEIMTHLSYLPFSFRIHRTYNDDNFNPISALFNFFERENISSLEEMASVANLEYDAHKDEYYFNKIESTYNSYISKMDIDDLLPWENLASLFNVDNHKLLTLKDGTTIEGYKCWRTKVVPVKNKMDQSKNIKYYTTAEFGWEEIWKSVDETISGNKNLFIPTENIVKIENLK